MEISVLMNKLIFFKKKNLKSLACLLLWELLSLSGNLFIELIFRPVFASTISFKDAL